MVALARRGPLSISEFLYDALPEVMRSGGYIPDDDVAAALEEYADLVGRP